MEAVRRYVFPIIWMIVLALIAVALVKLAFFGGDAAAEGPDVQAPIADVDTYALVPVTRGDITSTLELSATVEPDEGTAVRAADAGEIVKIWVKNGDNVLQGDRILQVKVEIQPEAAAAPAAGAATDPAAEPAATGPQYRYLTLKAPSDGRIEGLDALKGQMLSIGDPVATLSPGTYAITAPLTPEQQLQLLDQPLTASADLPSSTDPIPCQAPRIDEKDPSDETPATPATPEIDPATGMPVTTASSQASLRCPVPAGTRIVPGLEVDVVVDLGSAQGVLTVPTTAVEGEDTTGNVYVLDPSTGEPTAQEVTLGKRGDKVVEVTGGLEENEEILQFVPGVDNPDDQGVTW